LKAERLASLPAARKALELAQRQNSELLAACELALECLTEEKDSYLGDQDGDPQCGAVYDEEPYSDIKLAVARAKGCKVTGPIHGVYKIISPEREAREGK